MTDSNPGSRPETPRVDTHGAVDLGAGTAPVQGAPGAAGGPAPTSPADAGPSVQLDAPLITDVTEATFEDTVAVSRTVPVIVILWSERSLESRQAIDMMETLTRSMGGRFQLAKVDADANPAVVQAFQAQTLPTVVALVGGRPVPLFQGPAMREQVEPVLGDLLTAAAQMGVTGTIAVTEEQTEEPTPAEHLEALALEDAGDIDGAVAAWENVVTHNPKDQAAKDHLSRVRLQKRLYGEDGAADADAAADPLVRADAQFAAGDSEGAFTTLLDVIAAPADDDQKEQARVRLLDLLRVAGNTPEVKSARTRLASLLMI